MHRELVHREQFLQTLDASLIRFGPIFFELIEVTIDQRLDFHHIRGLKWVVSHLTHFVNILLLTSVKKVFEPLVSFGHIGIVLAKNKLLTAPPFLNSILNVRIMRPNASNQLFLEFLVGEIFFWLAGQRIKGGASATNLVVYLLVVHRVFEQHAQSQFLIFFLEV